MTLRSATRALVGAVLVTGMMALAGCATAVVPEEPVIVVASDVEPSVVGFYGDSYTYGTGASSEQTRWSTVLSTQYGWEEFNPSVSGLGFMRKRTLFGAGDLPSLIIEQSPDIVIVTLGLNDNFTFDEYADELPGQILSDFERLATELPDAQLIVVEPFWYKTQRPDSVDVIISWVSDAAAAVGADYISGASYWLTGHPEWMSEDNLHPNDAGHAAIASQMDLALRDLGL